MNQIKHLFLSAEELYSSNVRTNYYLSGISPVTDGIICYSVIISGSFSQIGKNNSARINFQVPCTTFLFIDVLRHNESFSVNMASQSFTSISYNLVYVDIRQTTIKLLGRPYVTQCIHYESTPLETQRNCVVKCVQQKCARNVYKLDRPPSNVSWLDDEIIPFSVNTSLNMFYNLTCVASISVICENICKHENCENHFYGRELRATYRNKIKNLFTLQMSPHIQPYIEYIHKPMETISELIANIGGTVGVWLGISFAHSRIMLILVGRVLFNFRQHSSLFSCISTYHYLLGIM